MANISAIKLPNGNTYNLVDKTSGYVTTDTTYSAGTGLSLSGTTFNHSNSITAGTAGTSSATSSTNRTISIPYITYDAQGHITGSGTHTHTLTSYPEAYLTWGGKDFSASYGPIDAAMISILGANRFAFLKAAGLTIEYSTDGGSTYTDYGATDTQKVGLFSSGQGFYLGKHGTAGTNTTNDRLRVTITTSTASLYTILNKIAIYMSTSGNTVQVLIEKALESTPTTFVTHKDWTNINGWSGWNILNISDVTTYGNTATSQYGRIRLTFKQTAINTNYSSASISKIQGFGGQGWTVPSNMARDGHLYAYDAGQNATFPAGIYPANNNTQNLGNSSQKWANVYATTFYGNLTGNVTGTASGNLTSNSTLSAAKLSGSIPSAVTATTQSASDNSTKIATTAYVTTAIANLPEPMLFKGSVGTGGTITSLPTAAAANEGWTYKVITALSSPAAKVGDTVISNGSEWVVIPSGDEPSGTVTSISAGTGLTTDQTNNAAITSSGTIKVKLNSETAITDTSKVYNVGVNSNGELCVKVSWSDIQTRTSDSGTERTIYLAGGTTSGDETDGLSKHESIKALVSSNTETDGYTILALGNRTSVDSAGAKYGCIRLYGKYNTFIDIRPQSLTNTGTIYLPFSGGTLVREEDLIPVAQQSSTLNVALVSSSSKSKFYDSHGGLTYTSLYFSDGSRGASTLTLGNNIATGTESNARGHIRLYGDSTYYTNINAPNSTATRTITLPDKTGTVALTSDIPTISYPVTSVNSKTGAVTLTASDVGALPNNTTGDDIAYDENTSVNAKIDTIISSSGEPNAINTISVNNVNQTITNKNVNIDTVLIGSTSDYTPAQVKSAIDAGKNVIITYTHSTYGNIVGYSFNYSQAYNALVSNTIAYYNNNYYLFELVGTLTNNNWSCEVTQIAQSSDIPTVPTNISAFTNDSGFTTKNMWYGTCSTGASTAAKAVTTSSGDFTLTTGSMVRVKFTNSNSYDGTATLNVDGKGAKNITKVGANTTTQYYWVSGEVVDFVYDGTNFVMSGKGTASVTYYGLTKLSSATDSTSVTLAATPKAVKTAYDLANSKQAELVSGTNIKTINNTSLLGSGDISVAADGTPIPTASEVAEFDTNAHMNSTDMTSSEIEDFVEDLDMGASGLLNMFYPVGSYYETSDSTFDPNVRWGGTWVLETEGQVHISSGVNYEVGDTGGASTVTLTTDEIPAHTHGSKSLTGTLTSRRQGANYVSHWGGGIVSISAGGTGTTSNGVGTSNQNADIATINATHEHDSVGGGGAHNNMPPYVVVNRWHRTA